MSAPSFRTARVKSVSQAENVVTAIVSTAAIDRDSEIILPEAFRASLDTYLTNPVLLWQHPWMYEELPGPGVVIGKAVNVRILPDSVEVDFAYAVDANPTAKMVFDLVASGFLQAYSVGFFPRQSVTRTSNQEALDGLPEAAREALLSGQAKAVHTAVEWFETSQVMVGSNREALATIRSLFIHPAQEGAMATERSKTRQEGAVAKVGHAPTNDIKHRLMGAIESLCGGYYGEEASEEPPEPEVCFGVIRVLEQVISDLQVLAKADDDDSALAPGTPVVTSPSAPAAGKAGRKFSADTVKCLKGIIALHDEGMKSHKAGCKALQDMLDEIEEDAENDSEGEEDQPKGRDDMSEASLSHIVRSILSRKK